MTTQSQPAPATLTGHTPGPWTEHRYQHVFMGEKLAVIRQGDSRKSLVCDVGPSEFGPGRHECEANMRLIAAAPDLLALARQSLRLQEFARLVSTGAGDRKLCQMEKELEAATRAAIAKTEGRA